MSTSTTTGLTVFLLIKWTRSRFFVSSLTDILEFRWNSKGQNSPFSLQLSVHGFTCTFTSCHYSTLQHWGRCWQEERGTLLLWSQKHEKIAMLMEITDSLQSSPMAPSVHLPLAPTVVLLETGNQRGNRNTSLFFLNSNKQIILWEKKTDQKCCWQEHFLTSHGNTTHPSSLTSSYNTECDEQLQLSWWQNLY